MCCLNSAALMDHIINALDRQEALSIVSVGATEAFVMAQYTLFSEQEFMNHPEARVANLGMKSGFYHRGIRFPNISARDAAVDAVKQADIVSYNTIVEPARVLTEQVFSAHGIKTDLFFEAHIRRVIMFSQKEKFYAMLKGKKLLLISSMSPQIKRAREAVYRRSYQCNIVGAISIHEYEDIARIKEEISKYQFDLCLLAAGINALILAPYIAKLYGKVAFDIGSSMKSLMTREIVMDEWLTDIIGVDKILHM